MVPRFLSGVTEKKGGVAIYWDGGELEEWAEENLIHTNVCMSKISSHSGSFVYNFKDTRIINWNNSINLEMNLGIRSTMRISICSLWDMFSSSLIISQCHQTLLYSLNSFQAKSGADLLLPGYLYSTYLPPEPYLSYSVVIFKFVWLLP